MVDQLVIGSAEYRVAGIRAEAGAIDQALRMLDAVADRKRLGFHADAALVQHRKSVACAVAERQDHMVGINLLARSQRHAANRFPGRAVFDQDIADTLLETDLAAQRFDFSAHPADHGDQAESADMRLGDKENFFRGAGLDEFVQHLARQMARIADLAPKLAIRKSACAAFTELHIRFGVQLPLAPQRPGVLGALAHRLATLKHDRPQAHLRQDQGRKNAARAETDHQRA